MGKFTLSSISEKNLRGVHPELIKVVRRAIEITETDFRVHDGVRSIEEQRRNVANGVSKTMNSKHLRSKKTGYSHAVDLVPYIDGRLQWAWPLCNNVAAAMKAAARELGVRIVWGGDWRRFKDGPHFELNERFYPR